MQALTLDLPSNKSPTSVRFEHAELWQTALKQELECPQIDRIDTVPVSRLHRISILGSYTAGFLKVTGRKVWVVRIGLNVGSGRIGAFWVRRSIWEIGLILDLGAVAAQVPSPFTTTHPMTRKPHSPLNPDAAGAIRIADVPPIS